MAQFLVVTHLGGLPELKENGIYTLMANNEGLVFQTGTFKKTDFATYLWDEIDASVGTEEELKERLTLSRIALVGPFAVFFRKKSTKVEYFLTITKDGNHGLFKVEPSANSNFKPVKALIELHQKPFIPEASGTTPAPSQAPIDPLDRLEKLARLLEQGILTQEEFDKKKTEILEL
jgi:hypothetical protein